MKKKSYREELKEIRELMEIGFVGCENERQEKQLERAYIEQIYRMLSEQELLLLSIDNRLGAIKDAKM